MEDAHDFPPDHTIQHLVSVICSLPFKGDDDYQEINYAQLDEARKMLSCQSALNRRRLKLLTAYRDSYFSAIKTDESKKFFRLYKLLARRSSIELNEMIKELTVRPDVWIQRLKDEQKCYSSILFGIAKSLKKVSLETVVHLLSDARKWLGYDGHKFDVRFALSAIQKLGSHPFFDQLIPFDADAIARVGSNLTGVPAPWLSCSLLPPKSWPMTLLAKFPAHLHAAAVLDNFFASATVRDGRPLAIFLVHDPGNLCSKDFASHVSESLYGTRDLSLHFDLSEGTPQPSANGVEDKLSELLIRVNKSPFSVVFLENIDKANNSVIEGLCFCLTNGYTVHGTRVDFSRTVFFMVFDSDSTQLLSPVCGALRSLCLHYGKTLMDLALGDIALSGDCRCNMILAEVKAKLKPKIWNLLDDVILLDLDAIYNISGYTRCLLREVARRFCDGSLIIYPSEAALQVIMLQSRCGKGTKALSRYLNDEVVPALDRMEANGEIDGECAVFIDRSVSHMDLSFRVAKVDDYLVDEFAQNFASLSNDWLGIYEKGKNLEESIQMLRERLDVLCKPVEGNIKEQLDSLIQIVDQAVIAANDIHTSKEALCFSIGKFDAPGPVPVNLKTGGGALSAEGKSAWPKLIKVLMQGFSRNRRSKLMRRSPSSYLLLGLNDIGKRKLLDVLKKNDCQDVAVPVFELDVLECTKDQFMIKSSSYGYGWKHVLEHVKDNPRCILFFDRIERAHISTFNLVISLLMHGEQIDCHGDRVDFGESVVVISTNVGNKDVMCQLVPHSGAVNDIVYPKSQQEGPTFRCELLNKVEEVVILNPFASQQLTSITRIPVSVEPCGLGPKLGVLFRQDCVSAYLRSIMVRNMLGRAIKWESVSGF